MTTREYGATVRTASGALQGSARDGVFAFRGVPFAQGPVGSGRFAPPRSVEAWNGTRSAERQAAAPPQLAGNPPRPADSVTTGSALSTPEVIMGPLPVPGFSEDSLTLNIWTPSPGPDARLPVLVFFHGGAWKTGAGSASWYDGSVMSRRGQIVVVTVNYRLGALGWLYLPNGVGGKGPVANLGLLDKIAALEWLHDNIAAFGGDPDNITVSGESAGGQSIVALQATKAAGSFRRAIVDSITLSESAVPGEVAAGITEIFLNAVGIEWRDPDKLLEFPVARILAAQAETMRLWNARATGEPYSPFEPVLDGLVITSDFAEAALSGSMDDVELLIAHTAQETRFWSAYDAEFWQQDEGTITGKLMEAADADRAQLYSAYAGLNTTASPAAALSALADDEYILPQLRLAERCSDKGRGAYFLWFSWPSPAADGRLGAAHTVDLPFVFKNFEEWSGGAILAGVDRGEFEALSTHVQDAWISFATTGNPGRPLGQEWPKFTAPECAAMEFGKSVGLIRDLLRRRRNLYKGA
ncbi:carboxylesterase/lipase family protein [Nocardia pseudovaccinii]|uniref:carboxylesterase/lipase family protein n=1 Tax=Nocardia pseudovaccinii TaxID=189540 RepID=UPI003D9472EA